MFVAEADFFVKTVQNYIGKAILILDWEEKFSPLVLPWAKRFLDRVYQKTGVKAFLYTTASVTRQYQLDIGGTGRISAVDGSVPEYEPAEWIPGQALDRRKRLWSI